MHQTREQELLALLRELIGEDPRRALLVQRVMHLSQAIIDAGTTESRQAVLNLAIDSCCQPGPGYPAASTPFDYPH